MPVTITAKKNGPYRVEAAEGEVRLLDAEGREYSLAGKPAFSLCRCGHSKNKPFCDGSHKAVGFQSDDQPPT
jgi:CDGSH-type Zn-finger protein